jgi:hypothetical protein
MVLPGYLYLVKVVSLHAMLADSMLFYWCSAQISSSHHSLKEGDESPSANVCQILISCQRLIWQVNFPGLHL